SYFAAPCPPGTYSNVSGAVNNYDCIECDAGYYCSSIAGGEPTGLCWGGYYCTGGASNPRQHIVDPGHYSPNGSASQIECLRGTYQPFPAQPSCLECEPGYVCPDKAMTDHNFCEAGRYCGNGTTVMSDCPPGTYSNQTHLTTLSECTICPRGYYCRDRGATAPTGMCNAGHICYEGAMDDDPVYNDDPSGNNTVVTYGDTCHEGYYCPQGTSFMIPCPIGTYNPSRSGKSESAACLPCDAGKYCNGTALTTPTGDCDAGYYCIGGAYLPNPSDNQTTGDICPLYYYCPAGSQSPRVCNAGYFSSTTGNSVCELCNEGYICYQREGPRLCPQGKYCPASTVTVPLTAPKNCPVGTFGATDGLKDSSECQTCTGGSYCDTPGQSNVTGPITGGFWSMRGSTVATPADTNNPDHGICPKGYYCEEGSTAPLPCPQGTYGFAVQYDALSDCINCPGGYYCPYNNMTEAGPQCDAGFYCSGGSSEAAPVAQAYGDECPTGHYCPAGSSTPVDCPAGQYSNTTRSTVCLSCPKGHYCPLATSEPLPCPLGYYCGAGTSIATSNPCPVGTYNNETGMNSVADCIDCWPGFYCGSQGIGVPVDLCGPGWYCSGGATAAQPSAAAQGGQCEAGYFCPEGSSVMLDCSPGTFCQ
ncbi:hypothetical protein EGW08_011983, partial [Elysia chlorotica]